MCRREIGNDKCLGGSNDFRYSESRVYADMGYTAKCIDRGLRRTGGSKSRRRIPGVE